MTGRGRRVNDHLLKRLERYQKLARKYHELAKVAQPAYLGDFYRGVAVRYVFMAQEVSNRAERKVASTAAGSDFPVDDAGLGNRPLAAGREFTAKADEGESLSPSYGDDGDSLTAMTGILIVNSHSQETPSTAPTRED
jgi:hypothetical protein